MSEMRHLVKIYKSTTEKQRYNKLPLDLVGSPLVQNMWILATKTPQIYRSHLCNTFQSAARTVDSTSHSNGPTSQQTIRRRLQKQGLHLLLDTSYHSGSDYSELGWLRRIGSRRNAIGDRSSVWMNTEFISVMVMGGCGCSWNVVNDTPSAVLIRWIAGQVVVWGLWERLS